jgi:hypothetical protein
MAAFRGGFRLSTLSSEDETPVEPPTGEWRVI